MSTIRFLLQFGRNSTRYGSRLQAQYNSTSTLLNSSFEKHSSDSKRVRQFSILEHNREHRLLVNKIIYAADNTGLLYVPHSILQSNLAQQRNCSSVKDATAKNIDKRIDKPVIKDEILLGSTSKLGLFAKFKLMYKKYWYVLIPVHLVTSLGWFGGFYYMSQSGVDIGAVLEYLHISENIIEKIHKSNMGHLAIAYLCYKIATPVRYAVTLGGTTLSIKYLVQAGYIKPMPTKERIMEMYEQKKADRAAAKAERDSKKD